MEVSAEGSGGAKSGPSGHTWGWIAQVVLCSGFHPVCRNIFYGCLVQVAPIVEVEKGMIKFPQNLIFTT